MIKSFLHLTAKYVIYFHVVTPYCCSSFNDLCCYCLLCTFPMHESLKTLMSSSDVI